MIGVDGPRRQTDANPRARFWFLRRQRRMARSPQMPLGRNGDCPTDEGPEDRPARDEPWGRDTAAAKLNASAPDQKNLLASLRKAQKEGADRGSSKAAQLRA